jgi:hypothetical protein
VHFPDARRQGLIKHKAKTPIGLRVFNRRA